jgi:hypothetical protein
MDVGGEVGGVVKVGEAGWQAESPAIASTIIVIKNFLGFKVNIWMIIPELKNQGAAYAAP